MADDSSPSLDALIGSRARDENGRFTSVTPTEEKPAEPAKAPVEAAPPAKAPEPVVTPAAPVTAPTPPAENAEAAAYKKAMREEREKRQALERQLAEARQPKPPVDPWADLPGALTSQEQKFEERLFLERCNTTEELARDRHKDFDEVREVFLEAAQSNPALFQQLRQERNPAEFAYREGLRIKELKDVNGDFSAYKSKLERDIEARLTAQFEAKYGKQPEVPTSLNSETSPAQQTPVYAGPPPLKTLLLNGSKAARR